MLSSCTALNFRKVPLYNLVDLVGRRYDAGDNVKFNFPMAFTTTMLAWSVLEFGQFRGTDLQHAMGAIKWATDCFLKATSHPGQVYVQVGEPYSDHNCWERWEDMDTFRTSYFVNQQRLGSEVSAEIAAALAALSWSSSATIPPMLPCFKRGLPQYVLA